jgi:hypothetical protein
MGPAVELSVTHAPGTGTPMGTRQGGFSALEPEFHILTAQAHGADARASRILTKNSTGVAPL